MSGMGGEGEELPPTIVRRVVKSKLSEVINDASVSIHREALIAFSESAKIFIHYLSATSNDICRESKRQTINAEDVLKALEELEFPELLDPLRTSLSAYRKHNASKKSESKAKSADRKRKSEVNLEMQNENGNHAEDANEMLDELGQGVEEENDDMEDL